MEEIDRENTLEITIGTSIINLDKAKEDANDLAWEHAKEIAQANELSLGSAEFENIFRELSQRYEGNTDYLKFFLMTAFLTVREILESKALAIPHTGDRITEREVLDLVSSAARTVMSSYMWLAAGQGLMWAKNKDLPDDFYVSFYFNPEDIESEEV